MVILMRYGVQAGFDIWGGATMTTGGSHVSLSPEWGLGDGVPGTAVSPARHVDGLPLPSR